MSAEAKQQHQWRSSSRTHSRKQRHRGHRQRRSEIRTSRRRVRHGGLGQVPDVQKTWSRQDLGSVSRLVEFGHSVVFRGPMQGSYMQNNSKRLQDVLAAALWFEGKKELGRKWTATNVGFSWRGMRRMRSPWGCLHWLRRARRRMCRKYPQRCARRVQKNTSHAVRPTCLAETGARFACKQRNATYTQAQCKRWSEQARASDCDG